MNWLGLLVCLFLEYWCCINCQGHIAYAKCARVVVGGVKIAKEYGNMCDHCESSH
jgi:hypothetical protein